MMEEKDAARQEARERQKEEVKAANERKRLLMEQRVLSAISAQDEALREQARVMADKERANEEKRRIFEADREAHNAHVRMLAEEKAERIVMVQRQMEEREEERKEVYRQKEAESRERLRLLAEEKEREEREKRWEAEERQRMRQEVLARARGDEDAKRDEWKMRLQEGELALERTLEKRRHERVIRLEEERLKKVQCVAPDAPLSELALTGITALASILHGRLLHGRRHESTEIRS